MIPRMMLGLGAVFIGLACSAGVRDGLLLYAPFEDGAEPEIFSGAKAAFPAKLGNAPGRVGQGIRVEKQGVGFGNVGNLNIRRGTVSMFFKPDQDFSSIQTTWNSIRAQHLAVCYQARGRMFFMTGKSVPGTGFRWDYSLDTGIPRSWKAGEWHHVAMQWDADAGVRSLWLDGKLIKTVSTQHFPDSISDNALVEFGAGMPGVVDEVYIYETILPPSELEMLAKKPEEAAAVLRSLPKAPARRNEPALGFEIKSLRPADLVVKPGEIFQAPVTPINRTGQALNLEVRFTLRDYQGAALQSFRQKLALAAGAKKTLLLPLQAQRRGAFKLEAAWTNPDGSEQKCDTASFAVWDKRQKPDPESFFGNHVNGWSTGAFFEQADKLGQNWMRNHNMVQTTWWYRVRPEPDAYRWGYDFQLESMKRYGMPLLGQLFTTPYWAVPAGVAAAKTDGYNECKMPDLKKFEAYVFDTVSRYKNDIHHWEIWNEPDVAMFFKGSPEEFAQLVQTAEKAAHRADPAAKVMAAGWTFSGWGWQRRAARAGAFKGLDAISFHYGTPQEEPEQYWTKFNDVVEHFQNLAVTHGDGKRLPIWNTEGGCVSTTFFAGLDEPFLPPQEKRVPQNPVEASMTVVKCSAVQMALGVKKHFIYLQNPPPRNSSAVYLNTSMIDFNNAPKPVLMSRVAMQEQLDYTDFAGCFRNESMRLMAFVFRPRTRPDESVVLLWTGKNGELRFEAGALGGVKRRIDLMGNEIAGGDDMVAVGESPVYLHCGSSAEKILAAFQTLKIQVAAQPAALPVQTVNTAPMVPVLPDYVSPQENPAGVFTVDLRQYCNMGFADDKAGNGKGGWADEGDLNDLRDLKPGRRTFYGVPFDVIDPASNNGKSIITLCGKAATKGFPVEVTGIPIGRSPWKLYFLQSSSWGGNGDIAEYIVHYADGTSEVIAMNIPGNNNNWWSGYAEGEYSRPVPVRVTNTTDGKPAWRYLRVFEWENRKKEKIETIDIRSKSTYSTPITIAISGV